MCPPRAAEEQSAVGKGQRLGEQTAEFCRSCAELRDSDLVEGRKERIERGVEDFIEPTRRRETTGVVGGIEALDQRQRRHRTNHVAHGCIEAPRGTPDAATPAAYRFNDPRAHQVLGDLLQVVARNPNAARGLG